MMERYNRRHAAMACLACALILISAWLPATRGLAAEQAQLRIDALYDSDKAYHSHYLNNLGQRLSKLPETAFHATPLHAYDGPAQTGNPAQTPNTPRGTAPERLTIAIGTAAAQRLLQSPPAHDIIFVLVSREYYQSSIRPHPSCQKVTCHAIFIEQPLQRFVALTRAIAPSHKRIGVIFSTRDAQRDTRLRELAKQYHRDISIHHIDAGHDLHHALPSILAQIDILLSLPDTAIYNSQSIRNILITTLHYKIPVIGYSASYVKAGATAGIYSSIDDIAAQTQQLISTLSASRQPGTYTMHPEQFSFDINYWVAQSLELQVPDKGSVERELLQSGTRAVE